MRFYVGDLIFWIRTCDYVRSCHESVYNLSDSIRGLSKHSEIDRELN